MHLTTRLVPAVAFAMLLPGAAAAAAQRQPAFPVSGAPYTELLAGDPLNNGRGNARPAGVPWNSLEGAGFANLDVRASRDITFLKGTPQARTMPCQSHSIRLISSTASITRTTWVR